MSASYLRFGRGESLRSLSAKADGTFPKTLFKKEYQITPKQWKAIEEVHLPSEWHHTGKYANKTYFYNPEDVKMAWIESYGYATLPKGLKGIETYEIRKVKENIRKLKYGNERWHSRRCTANKHISLADGFVRLVFRGEFDKASKLINNLHRGTYVTMSIETGQISMQVSVGGNLQSKRYGFPSTYIGLNYFNSINK